LKQYDHWLVTQDKEPVIPPSKWQHSEHLLTFTEAQAEAHQIGGEVAFSFTGQQKPVSEQEFDGGDVDATPEQVRRTIREYGASSRTPVDGDAILRLWDGSDAGYGADTSRADMAFVKHLYFWCKGDERLMDQCFRASERIRPKWDEYRGSHTYGEMTIHKVCRTNSETFGGRYVRS